MTLHPLLLPLLPLALLACEGAEVARLKMPVQSVRASGSMSDLGYSVTVTRARLALRDLRFTTSGEEHASLLRRFSEWLLPVAHAHPGHAAGGIVTGEMAGPFIATFGAEPVALGEGTLLVGPYTGADVTFRRAGEGDGLAGDDLLLGHSAHVEGTAMREGRTVRFSAVIDLEEGTQLFGVPFELEVQEDTREVLRLEWVPRGGSASSLTLFDLIDFFELDGDGDGEVTITPGQTEANILGRALQSHDFYAVSSARGES